MSIFDIKSPETLRKFVYGFLPVLGAVLVGAGYITSTNAAQWIGIALAVLSPALASVKTQSGFRTYFYPIVTAVGAALVAWGIVDDTTWQLWFMLVPAVLGNVAAGNVHDKVVVDGEVIVDEPLG